MRRQVLMAAYLATAAFFTAHAVNGLVWQELMRPPDHVANAGEAAPSAPPPENAAGLAEIIAAGTIFAAEIPAGAVFATPGMAGSAGTAAVALDAAKVVKLVGTVVQDGRGVLAVLQDLSTKRQKGYRPHENISGLGEVAEIHRDSIVIHEGSRWELLRLPAVIPASAGGAAVQPAETVSNRRILDRTLVSKALADPAGLQSQFRVVPIVSHGAPGGLRLDMYRTDSLFARLGLQPGDIFQQVNGVRATDARVLLALFSQLPHEEEFTLDLLRRGQPMTITYEIR